MNRRATRPHRRDRWLATLVLAIAFAAPTRGLALDAEASRGPLDGPIVALLAKVIPTVVAIHTRRDLSAADAEPDAPTAAFSPKIQRAEGSGFIVSRDGFIATNKHVVHGAYDVTVSLHDGRSKPARIVWESTTVDVAFLKIETGEPLPAATFARDGMLQLGRRVVVIGNPLGLGISASAGIVSAVDRNLKQTPYDNYVQTDAAINSGNSGGPLFDLDGEVVGMSSIFWTIGKDQGSQGLGFAIPGADISFLIKQLQSKGRIECGTIGLKGQRLTPAMGEAVGFPDDHGVIVAGMEPNSPAIEAGLRLGDIVETFDGKPLYEVTTLNRATCLALGHTARVEVWRDGRHLTLQTRVDHATDGMVELTDKAARMAPRFANARDLGLTLAPVDDAARQQYHLGAGAHGYVVVTVADASEAENASLAPGDVIASLQMKPLSGAEPFDSMFADQGRAGHRHVILLVEATGGDRWITLPVRLTGPP